LPNIRNDNFAPPLPVSPHTGFFCPAKVVGWGWGKILVSHHKVRWGGDVFRLFRPNPPTLIGVKL